MPGTAARRATFPAVIAAHSSSTAIPESTAVASFGPTLLTLISCSKSAFSCGVAKPKSVMASSRTWVEISSTASSPSAASV
jgi:hypothetical protein